MKNLSRLLSVVLALVLAMGLAPIVAPITAVAADSTHTYEVSGKVDYDGAFEMFEQLNALRDSVGAPALTMDESLLNLAAQRATECAIYFEHTRPYGIHIFDETGYCENINASTGGADFGAARSMERFIASTAHYSNMIDPVHNAVGIARFDQGNGSYYWVQIFDNGKIASPVSASNTGSRQESRNVKALDSLLNLEIYPSSASIKVGEKRTFPLYNSENQGLIIPGVSATYGKGMCQITPSYCHSSDNGVVTVDSSGKATGVSAGSATIKIGVGSTLFKEVSITVVEGDDPVTSTAQKPIITKQPSDVTVDLNERVSLSVAASVSKGSLSYQWYSSVTRTSQGGTLISGATLATYSPPTDGTVTLYYYCIVTNTDGNDSASTTSNSAKVTVNKAATLTDGTVKVVFGRQYKMLDIKWSDDWFRESATKYYNDGGNLDLAIASLALSDVAYDEYDVKETLGTFGFSDVKTYKYSGDNFLNAGHAIAHKEIDDFTVIAIAIRGTPPLDRALATGYGEREWISGITGLINAASSDVSDNLLKYLSGLGNPRNVKVWLVGHSRGGAVANFLGSALSDGIYGQKNVFSYGFASPNTVNPFIKGNYKNIYTWANKKDIVVFSPIPSFDTEKFGKTHYFSPGDAEIDHYKLLTEETKVQPHSTEIYMAHLLKGKTVSELRPKIISIRCPVDVEIFDRMGNLVGRIADDTIDETINQDIAIWIDGDEKYLVIPSEFAYEIDLVGTDIGVMEYTISEYGSDDEIGREVVFKDVPLSKGKSYSGLISGKSGAAPETYNLTADDGSIVSYSYVTDGNSGLPFTDVYQSDWFYDTICSVYTENLMVGTSSTTFSPNGNVTISQAITMAARALAGGDGAFSTSGAGNWYDTYVSYAIGNGFIKPNDFSDYDAVATRAQMAYIFSGVIPSDASEVSSLTPPDVRESDKYGKEIYRLYRTGILNGNDTKGTFAPYSDITRAEAAAIILRVHLLLTAEKPAQANPEESGVSESSDVVSFNFSSAKWNTTFSDRFDTFELSFSCKSEQIITSAGIKCWDDAGNEIPDDGGKVSNYDTQYFKYRTDIYYTAWDNGSNTGKLIPGKTYYWIGYAICDGQRYETPVQSFVFSKDGARYK